MTVDYWKLNQMVIPNVAAISEVGSLEEKINIDLCHWCTSSNFDR